MLHRSLSLKYPRQIAYIRKNGKRYYSRFFCCTIIPIRKDEAGKILISFSKKIFRKAHERNHMRRKIVSLLRKRNEVKSYNIIFSAHKNPQKISFPILKDDFNNLLKKIH